MACANATTSLRLLLFIDQQPRRANAAVLYTSRTDDYRLRAFPLYGLLSSRSRNSQNADDCSASKKQRLSPLFVSVHARCCAAQPACWSIPGRPAAATQLGWVCRTAACKIMLQVVVCPGLNAGEALLRPASKGSGRLALRLWPAVPSAAWCRWG